jgi:hypothetical protein
MKFTGTLCIYGSICFPWRSILDQKIPYDAEPFRIQWFPANWFSRPAIPVRRIAQIALLAMQVGVKPTTLGAFVLLSRFVSPLPIALGIQPHPARARLSPAGGVGGGEGLANSSTDMQILSACFLPSGRAFINLSNHNPDVQVASVRMCAGMLAMTV